MCGEHVGHTPPLVPRTCFPLNLRLLNTRTQGTVSDQPEKFFVAEIVREKIFFLYDQEVPYCTQVRWG